jgi:hypothetical protein
MLPSQCGRGKVGRADASAAAKPLRITPTSTRPHRCTGAWAKPGAGPPNVKGSNGPLFSLQPPGKCIRAGHQASNLYADLMLSPGFMRALCK